MGRKERTWLQNIQEGKGREIARIFFSTFTTKTKATQYLYPNNYKRRREKYKRGYVEPIISKRLDEWEKMRFIEISNRKIQYIIETKSKKKKLEGKPTYAYLMNLEPLYKFCNQVLNIEFTEKEREFLDFHFKLGGIRKLILTEYPNEDVINAVIKFYIKHYIIPYGYILRFKTDFPKKFKKYEEKAERVNLDKNKWNLKPTKELVKMSEDFYKKEGFTKEQIKGMIKLHKEIMNKTNEERKTKKYDFLDVLSYESEFMWDGFRDYISKAKKDKELIYSIDKKFMKALGIFPE